MHEVTPFLKFAHIILCRNYCPIAERYCEPGALFQDL